MSESRLILVDGSGYIFRAYYALPPMNNSKGIPTNAVYGFCNMMLRLIDEHPNDKILIILDAGKNTFRNTLYPEYKANRSEADRKSTRLNSSHSQQSRMPSSA